MNTSDMTRRRALGHGAAWALGSTVCGTHAQPAPQSPSGGPVTLLTAHPVVHALAVALTHGTGLRVLRPAPESLPPNRLHAYFSGRGAAVLAEAAAQADAALTLRSIWPDDPLYPLARRSRIRLIEIDAARPVDGALPGVALQAGDRPALDTLPWLDPTNLHRMADILASDLGRLAPLNRDAVAAQLTALRRRLLGITSVTESRLAQAHSVSVWRLSDRLDYFISGFNLDPAGRSVLDDGIWTPDASAALVAQLQEHDVDVVLHHQPLPEALNAALSQASRRVAVLDTAGRDPVGELASNAARLTAALFPRD